ncbi:MAG TPA: hypothetical protein P5114_09005, partial [Hyphomicrobiaceae bacterium]|nr:hypothetical protein [Hyphomicrobiaceae bacterium]
LERRALYRNQSCFSSGAPIHKEGDADRSGATDKSHARIVEWNGLLNMLFTALLLRTSAQHLLSRSSGLTSCVHMRQP